MKIIVRHPLTVKIIVRDPPNYENHSWGPPITMKKSTGVIKDCGPPVMVQWEFLTTLPKGSVLRRKFGAGVAGAK